MIYQSIRREALSGEFQPSFSQSPSFDPTVTVNLRSREGPAKVLASNDYQTMQHYRSVDPLD